VNCSRYLNNALAMNETKVRTVLTAFYNIMREKPVGIQSDQVSESLTGKIGFPFNFKDFNCHSMLEFLKKYIMPTIDIEIISNASNDTDAFLIRSKKIFMDYNQELTQLQK
jgi:hypothetical protein